MTWPDSVDSIGFILKSKFSIKKKIQFLGIQLGLQNLGHAMYMFWVSSNMWAFMKSIPLHEHNALCE